MRMAGGSSDSSGEFTRRLGSNELFCHFCHNVGNLNVMTGLTLLTRHAIDEGLLKCALQEFQHTYPQLTSRIRQCGPTGKCPTQVQDNCNCQNLHFTPMECPILPLDITFGCKDMLHQKFDTNQGPLWRVQLITEASMDLANLGFGPELQAILEDDASQETRWRYFLRYIQGKVNQTDILPYDEEEEGFRSFILMTFHPSITDQVGAFHFMRQFLVVLDSILEQEGNQVNTKSEELNLHLPIESLLPTKDSTFQIKDILPIGKLVRDYVMPYRSPLEGILQPSTVDSNSEQKTEILRGWLNEEETRELMAMLEEDDCSLHGVIMAAGLLAVSRILQDDQNKMLNCHDTISLRVSNEMNLRQYCVVASQKMLGSHTTYYESDYTVPPIQDRTEFWKFAHELTVKHNASKGTKEPLQMLRIYNRMLYIGGGEQSFKDMDKNNRMRNEMSVNVYGDLGHLMRRSFDSSPSVNNFQSIDTWNRPLSSSKSNIRLEDVLHAVAAPNMGSPFSHSAHILHDRLNYFLCYHTTYVKDQRFAFNVRDETINILRMAVEKPE